MSLPKPIRWSVHAQVRLDRRDIDAEEVRRTIASPEFVVPGLPPRRVYMRRYSEPSTGKTMLLRVVVEETETDLVVLTVYRTSKVRKHLRGVV